MSRTNRDVKVIQFFHPGREHITDYKKSGDKRHEWNKKLVLTSGMMPFNKGEHRRKFIMNKGCYIDKDGKLSNQGKILFWGEWESPSKFEKIQYSGLDNELRNYFPNLKNKIIHSNKIDEFFKKNGIPQFVHNELFIEDSSKSRENTDPYIYGDKFYYCCCKQAGYPMLREHLGIGSLIVFGSYLEGKFFVDTVFAVSKYDPYLVMNIAKLKEERQLSDTYYHASLKPMLDGTSENITGEEFTLYTGATYYNPITLNRKTIYSFFPCKQVDATDGKTIQTSNIYKYKKPILDWDKYCLFNSTRGISNRIQRFQGAYNLTISNEDTVALYWEMLVDDIRSQGFEIGVWTEEPNVKFVTA